MVNSFYMWGTGWGWGAPGEMRKLFIENYGRHWIDTSMPVFVAEWQEVNIWWELSKLNPQFKVGFVSFVHWLSLVRRSPSLREMLISVILLRKLNCFCVPCSSLHCLILLASCMFFKKNKKNKNILNQSINLFRH